jgi:hypothetical protein
MRKTRKPARRNAVITSRPRNRGSEAWSDGDALHSDELRRRPDMSLDLQAQLNRFANPNDELIK